MLTGAVINIRVQPVGVPGISVWHATTVNLDDHYVPVLKRLMSRPTVAVKLQLLL